MAFRQCFDLYSMQYSKEKKGKVEYFKLPINALLKKGQIPATLWAFFKDAIFDLNEYQSFVDSMIAKYSSFHSVIFCGYLKLKKLLHKSYLMT